MNFIICVVNTIFNSFSAMNQNKLIRKVNININYIEFHKLNSCYQ